MCTVIVTIRSVLWSVMTIAASLMILVSIFTNQWLIGTSSVGSPPSMGLFGGEDICQQLGESSLMSFAAVLFTMGLLAYPAGWSAPEVQRMCHNSNSFVLGNCKLGGAYWMAVAGTVCTFLASSLTVFAYKSTKSHKTMYRRQDGERVICVP